MTLTTINFGSNLSIEIPSFYHVSNGEISQGRKFNYEFSQWMTEKIDFKENFHHWSFYSLSIFMTLSSD